MGAAQPRLLPRLPQNQHSSIALFGALETQLSAYHLGDE